MIAAPDARLIWHADLDPGILRVVALAASPGDPDAIVPAQLAPWLEVVTGCDGVEHAALSDGWRRIRLDVEAGSLAGGPVVLHYRLHGVAGARPKLLPLRRLIGLCRGRRFPASLFPRDPRVDRWLAALRVHDALGAGASQREIGDALFGTPGAREEGPWADSRRSHVRRLIRQARALASGGYRLLMRGGTRD